MLLHFYVKGRPPGSSAPPSESESTSYVDTAMNWTKETASHVSEMSFEEMLETAKARVEAGVDAAKQLFKFLNGDSVPKSQAPEPVKQEVKVEEKKGWSSGFTGLFSGLRGTARSPAESRGDTTDGKVYSEGEVHADLVMVRVFLFARLSITTARQKVVASDSPLGYCRLCPYRLRGCLDRSACFSYSHGSC